MKKNGNNKRLMSRENNKGRPMHEGLRWLKLCQQTSQSASFEEDIDLFEKLNKNLGWNKMSEKGGCGGRRGVAGPGVKQ